MFGRCYMLPTENKVPAGTLPEPNTDRTWTYVYVDPCRRRLDAVLEDSASTYIGPVTSTPMWQTFGHFSCRLTVLDIAKLFVEERYAGQ